MGRSVHAMTVIVFAMSSVSSHCLLACVCSRADSLEPPSVFPIILAAFPGVLVWAWPSRKNFLSSSCRLMLD